LEKGEKIKKNAGKFQKIWNILEIILELEEHAKVSKMGFLAQDGSQRGNVGVGVWPDFSSKLIKVKLIISFLVYCIM